MIKGIEFIKNKAQKQDYNHYYYGKTFFDAKPYDTEPTKNYDLLEIDDDVQLQIDNDKLLKTFPPCIANMLAEGELKYRQRFYVFNYLVNR